MVSEAALESERPFGGTRLICLHGMVWRQPAISVERIRFPLYEQVNWLALALIAGCTAAFLGGAAVATARLRGMLIRRGADTRRTAGQRGPSPTRTAEGRRA